MAEETEKEMALEAAEGKALEAINSKLAAKTAEKALREMKIETEAAKNAAATKLEEKKQALTNIEKMKSEKEAEMKVLEEKLKKVKESAQELAVEREKASEEVKKESEAKKEVEADAKKKVNDMEAEFKLRSDAALKAADEAKSAHEKIACAGMVCARGEERGDDSAGRRKRRPNGQRGQQHTPPRRLPEGRGAFGACGGDNGLRRRRLVRLCTL